ncbi:hypothetical protein D3C86_131920 [compost metagenome]
MPPIDIAPHRIDRRDAKPEADAGDQRTREHRAGRRRIVIGGIRRIRPGAIHHRRVVAGHVDHLRIRRLDHHDGLVIGRAGRHRLLRRTLQVARLLGLGAQPLDRIHDGLRLRQEGVADGLHPFRLPAHHVHDRGERHQGFDAGIPGLAFDCLGGLVAGFGSVRGRPFRGRRDVVGIGGPHEDLRQQRIRIQRHGRHQLVQLRVGQLGLRPGRQADRQPQAKQADQPFLQSPHFRSPFAKQVATSLEGIAKSRTQYILLAGALEARAGYVFTPPRITAWRRKPRLP